MNEEPSTELVVAEVRQALVTLLPTEDLAQVDTEAIGPTTPLLSLPIDSVVLMSVMNELEERFNVFITEEAAFAFITVDDIAHYIRGRLAAKASRLTGG